MGKPGNTPLLIFVVKCYNADYLCRNLGRAGAELDGEGGKRQKGKAKEVASYTELGLAFPLGGDEQENSKRNTREPYRIGTAISAGVGEEEAAMKKTTGLSLPPMQGKPLLPLVFAAKFFYPVPLHGTLCSVWNRKCSLSGKGNRKYLPLLSCFSLKKN